MRRNMDLIRAIALGRDTSEWTPEEVGHHIYLMGQGGLAHVVDVTGYGFRGLPQAALVCLTREGHDFADLANDEWRVPNDTSQDVPDSGGWVRCK